VARRDPAEPGAQGNLLLVIPNAVRNLVGSRKDLNHCHFERSEKSGNPTPARFLTAFGMTNMIFQRFPSFGLTSFAVVEHLSLRSK